jgi:hypothetical protein
LSSMLFIHSILIFSYFYKYGFTRNTVLLIGYLIIFMFDAFPTILLHLQYLSVNRNAMLVVREQQRTLSYIQEENHLDYSFDSIEQIMYIAGYGNGAWYSFSEYRYFVLVFTDGNKILISSLMMKYDKKKLESIFGMQVKTDMRFYPFIRRTRDMPGHRGGNENFDSNARERARIKR